MQALPQTSGHFPHRMVQDPRGFLLPRFVNVGRHLMAANVVLRPTSKNLQESGHPACSLDLDRRSSSGHPMPRVSKVKQLNAPQEATFLGEVRSEPFAGFKSIPEPLQRRAGRVKVICNTVGTKQRNDIRCIVHDLTTHHDVCRRFANPQRND